MRPTDANKTRLILSEMLTRCTTKEEQSALREAMKAVRKDIKMPICFVYDHLGGTPYVCPSCGGTLYDSDWYESTKREYHHGRCVHCGQSIDWEAKNISEYKGRTAYSRPIQEE